MHFVCDLDFQLDTSVFVFFATNRVVCLHLDGIVLLLEVLHLLGQFSVHVMGEDMVDGGEAEDGSVDGGEDADDDQHHAHDQALLRRHCSLSCFLKD